MNNIKTTAVGIVLLAVGAFGGATLTSNAQVEGEAILTKLDNKTATETVSVSTTLDIEELKQSIENLRLSKQSLNNSCSEQNDSYATKIQAVKAKIDSLKNLGIE
jgi:hypothetical protein